MEIFGGFMVMVSIFGFLLAVVWLVLPFVVLAIKVKIDKSFLLLEEMERRLASLERTLASPRPDASTPAPSTDTDMPHGGETESPTSSTS